MKHISNIIYFKSIFQRKYDMQVVWSSFTYQLETKQKNIVSSIFLCKFYRIIYTHWISMSSLVLFILFIVRQALGLILQNGLWMKEHYIISKQKHLRLIMHPRSPRSFFCCIIQNDHRSHTVKLEHLSLSWSTVRHTSHQSVTDTEH